MHSLLPLISTSCIVISAILVAVGWYFIRKGNRPAHQRVMVVASVFAVLFFAIYLSRTIFVGNTSFGGPEHLRAIYLVFLLFHIVLATAAAVLGLTVLALAYKGSFFKHKKLGRVTAVIWFITAITGVTVYYLLYVKYPGGETTGLIEAIFGK
jgi:putative membrane protein